MERFYNVVEIFVSVEGEGKRSGSLAQFIRLAGCNLHCPYCDTKYAWDTTNTPVIFSKMTSEDIFSALRTDIKNITITGGEPLLSQGISSLIKQLLTNGFHVNVETNGAVAIAPYQEMQKKTPNGSGTLFFTIDYKLPSSGMEQRMLQENFLALSSSDVIKFVIASDDDIRAMLHFLQKTKTIYSANKCDMPHIYLGTVWDAYSAEKLVEWMKKEPLLTDARLQLQIHKFIWDPEKRGV